MYLRGLRGRLSRFLMRRMLSASYAFWCKTGSNQSRQSNKAAIPTPSPITSTSFVSFSRSRVILFSSVFIIFSKTSICSPSVGFFDFRSLRWFQTCFWREVERTLSSEGVAFVILDIVEIVDVFEISTLRVSQPRQVKRSSLTVSRSFPEHLLFRVSFYFADDRFALLAAGIIGSAIEVTKDKDKRICNNFTHGRNEALFGYWHATVWQRSRKRLSKKHNQRYFLF